MQSIEDVEFPQAKQVYNRLGTKNGKTMAELVTETGLPVGTIRTAIRKLEGKQLIGLGDRRRTGKRGRPAETYVKKVAPKAEQAAA